MTQQTPPNASDDNDQNVYGSDPSFVQKPGMERNPYYQGAQPAAEPNLDAGSPALTSVEAQRLNRKALLFLGGIVLVLLALAFFVLRDDEEPAPAPQNDGQVAIPEAPLVTPPEEELPVPPVELAQEPVPLPSDQALPNDGQYEQQQFDSQQQPTGPQPPTLQQRRMMAAGGSGQGSADGAEGGNQEVDSLALVREMAAANNIAAGLPPGGAAQATVATATSAQFMSNPNALLVRGTYLRCVLETRIITDFPGFTSCIVTEPVYSVNGKRLLLPKGSKILGKYNNQTDGIARVAVIWDRVITPTGIDVSMSSPGVDGLGGAGHPGDYNGHWASKITSALLISLIADGFSYAAAENGPETTVIGAGGVVTQQPFQSATARSMERLANQALEKSANRRGTVTINQGSVVNIYVAQDVDFTSVLALR